MVNSKKPSAKNKAVSNSRPATRTTKTPAESRASESLTVFWAITVLTVLVANLVTIGAHFYLMANPDAEKMALLKGLLLFASSCVGALSLIVLPILYRVRTMPPPTGLTVFGACVAVAPILAVLAIAFQ